MMGDYYSGLMKEVRLYSMALGGETLTQPTSSKHLLSILVPSACSTGQFYNGGTSSCEACHALCSHCTSASNGNCQACVTDATLTASTCTCDSGFFFDSSSCVSCDPLCGECTATGSTNCSSCAPGALSIDGTTECVASCPSGRY